MGRVIYLPNSMISTEAIAMYSRGFESIWNEIPVLTPSESNWQEAKKILPNIAREHVEHLSKEAETRLLGVSLRYIIYYTSLSPIVYTTERNSRVLLSLRYLIEPRKGRISEQAIWEAILKAFAAREDIDFAYPTYLFFNNVIEGKSETRPVPDVTK